jgi:hypothetical protein
LGDAERRHDHDRGRRFGAITALGGGSTVSIVATGTASDTVTITGGSVSLGTNASATVSGNSDTLTETGGATVTSTGSGNTLTATATGNKATLACGRVNVGTGSAAGLLTLASNNFQIIEQRASSNVVTSGTGISVDREPICGLTPR